MAGPGSPPSLRLGDLPLWTLVPRSRLRLGVVPGDEWGPAWSPGRRARLRRLGAAAAFGRFRGGFGGVDFAAAISPEIYLFVPERQFLAPRLDSYYVPRARQVTSTGGPGTSPLTRWSTSGSSPGLPVDRVQRVIGRPVAALPDRRPGESQRHQGGRIQSNGSPFFRPQVQKTTSRRPRNDRPRGARW